MKRILLLLITLATITSCKSQKDVVFQSVLDKQMNEFYGYSHKILSLSIEDGIVNISWLTKGNLEILTHLKISKVDGYEEYNDSSTISFTVQKYPLHRYFKISALDSIPEAVNEFIGMAVIKTIISEKAKSHKNLIL